ncbi:DUF1365 domain-containing protein [Variovorax sp. OV084]|jgi:DUF1365 family protein|uniref:DUF1365 domain-containing protein n=1 Tax=Variovorax sp. OV084 TaxID=1882777 RepID=UPI0008B3B123|nr:DUF1365 domain-containing protein [Variovorax sp. OV084]SET38611.1 hypothetical protein SAMN05443580_103189 [Variovorax sp. OV084]
MTPAQTAVPLMGFGEVRHTRLRPARNAFVYPTYFLMLPMRTLRAHGSKAVALNRAAAISFHDVDHGDARPPAQGGALAWLDDLLAAHQILDAGGEAWLHCYPRVFGYTFKPVSFWYCHTPEGVLRAIVVEVNNTFGERHCYLLDRPTYGAELQATKAFHVSPFCRVDGSYRFRFFVDAGRAHTVVRIDHDDADGPLLQTSVSGDLGPMTAASVRRALWRYPAMTFGLIARIHWQAVKLWLKHVPLVAKPAPPTHFVSRDNQQQANP